jgi:Protein of unknown function (DUF541)
MSEERLRFIEVIGHAPAAVGEALEEAQRAAVQAARRSAETLAEEAGVRVTGLQQIAEIAAEGDSGFTGLRFRVRFGIEPAKSSSSRAGFQSPD